MNICMRIPTSIGFERLILFFSRDCVPNPTESLAKERAYSEGFHDGSRLRSERVSN